MKKIDMARIPAAALAKMEARAAEKREPIDNTELVRQFRAQGGHIVHVRPRAVFNGAVTRGMTVAFVIKGGRIQLATAVTHRADDFTKKIGTKTAIEHFNAGKTVFLPFRGDTTKEDLYSALSFIC